MRIQSEWARWLLWMSLLWGVTPLVGTAICMAMARWGFWALSVIAFLGAVAAAIVVEMIHRRCTRTGPAPEGKADAA